MVVTRNANSIRRFSDPVFVRTYLVLIAAFFLLIGLWMLIFSNASETWQGIILLSILLLIGLYFLVTGIIAKNAYAEKIARKTGNHELLFLVVALAGIVSTAVQKIIGISKQQNNNSSD